MQPNASREILSPVEPMLMYSIASPVPVIRIAHHNSNQTSITCVPFRAAGRMRKCHSIGYNAAP
jgi:hypothetical protein